jgi:hypothetical protein
MNICKTHLIENWSRLIREYGMTKLCIHSSFSPRNFGRIVQRLNKGKGKYIALTGRGGS